MCKCYFTVWLVTEERLYGQFMLQQKELGHRFTVRDIMMENVFVFGTGKFAEEIFEDILKQYNVMGLIDNDVKKQNMAWSYDARYYVISPSDIPKETHGRIVIASINYAAEIFAQLLSLGIREHDIVVDFVSVKKKVYLYDFVKMQKNDIFVDNRMDIFVKYMVILEYYELVEGAYEAYIKMQRERLRITEKEAQDALEKYKCLIRSFEQEGYRSDSFIVCDEKMRIMDGAHRTALCLYFGVPYVSVQIVPRTFSCEFSVDWFWEKGYDIEFVRKIEDTKKELLVNNEVITAVLWPPAERFFDEITEILNILSEVISWKDYEFQSYSYFSDILREIYSVDDIAKWKVEKKLLHMDTGHICIRVIQLRISQPEYRLKVNTHLPISKRVETIKRIIRGRYVDQVSNYFFDTIIHIADNYDQSRNINQIFNNEEN